MFEHLKPQYVTIDRKRHYSFEGVAYPSVTGILSATKPARDRQALQNWRRRVGYQQAQKITTKAAKRGTSVHSAIKYYLRQQPVPEDIDDNPFWHSILPVLDRIDRVHLDESAIYHSEEGYAGCYDCLGEWQGKLCVFDWKTASKPKKQEWIVDYCLQVAAYISAVNHFYRVNIQQGIVAIALDSQPAQLFVLEAEDLADYQQQFLNRLRLFSVQHDKY
ncbi:MAG: hypothetical protein ACFCAD_13820 [Pleurocapsa sp.]